MTTTATIALIVFAVAVVLGILALIARGDMQGNADEPLVVSAGPRNRPGPRHRMRHASRELPSMWLHDEPRQPMTLERAHREMQLHLDCLHHECPRKRAARAVLINEGHMVPARRPVRA